VRLLVILVGWINIDGVDLNTHVSFTLAPCFTLKSWVISIVVTYEIRVFFEGAEKEVFSSIFKKNIIKIQRLENWPLYQVFSSIFLKAQKNVKYAYV
jgi:hypothetical protein